MNYVDFTHKKISIINVQVTEVISSSLDEPNQNWSKKKNRKKLITFV